MLKASNFLSVTRGNSEYLFILVAGEHWFEGQARDSLIPVLEKVFARNLGDRGTLVISFTKDAKSNLEQVLAKDWPPLVRDALEYSPAQLLVIDKDFEEFSPPEHSYILIDFRDAPTDGVTAHRVLQQLEHAVNTRESLFAWWERKALSGRTILRSLKEAIEARPGVLGFSVNLNKFLSWNSYFEVR